MTNELLRQLGERYLAFQQQARRIPDPLGSAVRPFVAPMAEQFRKDPMGTLRGAVAPDPRDLVSFGAQAMEQARRGQMIQALGSIVQAGSPFGMIGPDRRLGTGGAFFHGAAKPIENLTDAYYSGRNVYGEGFYATDAPDVAASYTKKNARSAGPEYTPTQYRVAERAQVKMYPLDSAPTPTFLRGLESAAQWSESASDALALYRAGEIKTAAGLMDEMRRVSREYGESADTITEAFDTIRSHLESDGYGGFTHQGGKLTGGKPHNVRIYWEPKGSVSLHGPKGEVK